MHLLCSQETFYVVKVSMELEKHSYWSIYAKCCKALNTKLCLCCLPNNHWNQRLTYFGKTLQRCRTVKIYWTTLLCSETASYIRNLALSSELLTCFSAIRRLLAKLKISWKNLKRAKSYYWWYQSQGALFSEEWANQNLLTCLKRSWVIKRLKV